MAFPVVDAFLLEPEQGKNGKIAICTNTLAPGMVSNEIPLDLRDDITVLGSLVVNRDGCERMILNCLAHPSIEYLILFGQETLSFCPSTNLLNALMDGYRDDKPGNLIVGGKGISHHYPNIAPHLLEQFKQRVKVIPLHSHHPTHTTEKYIGWLNGRIPSQIFELVTSIRSKKKIYYDGLVSMIKAISSLPQSTVTAIELDPKDFQHLQPPIIEVIGDNDIIGVPFSVKAEEDLICVNIDFETGNYVIKSTDSFLMAYSLMDFMNKQGLELSHLNQLLLGVEMSRIEMQIKSGVTSPHTTRYDAKDVPLTEIKIAARSILKADSKYYYKMGIKDKKVSVQSMAHDTCETVFDLRGTKVNPLIKRLAEENRFEDYNQQALHRMDVGIEVGRAAIALEIGMSYFQDFRNLFSENKKEFPMLVVEGDNFLSVHQKIITQLYTRGIITTHPDAHKGTMKSATILGVYRRSKDSLSHLSEIYATSSLSAKEMREQYKQQLLDANPKGSYTYGHRTLAHFGKDQLKQAVEFLKENPGQVYVIQRFDPITDMTITEIPIFDDNGKIARTRLEATHDPCLTHDIYFLCDGKLQSFHIARAHNIVNAYPENIFGLHDAYDETVASGLGVGLGDMFMLSSRGNMLLLTEEQKAKKLIAEPAKPIEGSDNSMGPYDLRHSFPSKGVGMFSTPLEAVNDRVRHPCLDILENYNGVNLIEKATHYLLKKGDGHNNPILTCLDPRTVHMIQPQHRLVFFQCNQRGGKLQATAVFADGENSSLSSDVQLCNYISTKYSRILDIALGNLTIFYTPMRT